ncbi:unnamed protein product [Caenorhabditis nigoni]
MVNDFNMCHKLIETIANQKMYFYSYRKQKAVFLTKKIKLLQKQAPLPYSNQLDYAIQGYSSQRVSTENYPSLDALLVSHEKLWEDLQPKSLRAEIDSCPEGIELSFTPIPRSQGSCELCTLALRSVDKSGGPTKSAACAHVDAFVEASGHRH